MWMLLRSSDSSGAAVEPTSSARSPAAASSNPRAEGNGHAVGAAEPVEVRLFLHPGRSALGTIGLARWREQFAVDPNTVFGCLLEAERALTDRSAFLAEVVSGGDGSTTAPPPGAVLVAWRLR